MRRHIGMAVGTGEELQWQPVVTNAEMFDEVKHAMDALTPRERESLLLWNAGMNYREIADRTSQSSDVVGVVLARARNRLMMACDLLGM